MAGASADSRVVFAPTIDSSMFRGDAEFLPDLRIRSRAFSSSQVESSPSPRGLPSLLLAYPAPAGVALLEAEDQSF
jgi:hypothetical protein